MQIETTKDVILEQAGDVSLIRVDAINLNSHTGKRSTVAVSYAVMRGDDDLIWKRQTKAWDGSTPDSLAYKSCLTMFNKVTGENRPAAF